MMSPILQGFFVVFTGLAFSGENAAHNHMNYKVLFATASLFYKEAQCYGI
jgi:hypothetical protein